MAQIVGMGMTAGTGLLKMSKCKICSIEFERRMKMQVVCSIECAITLTEIKRIKKAAKVAPEKKCATGLGDRKKQLRLAQTAFNRYIRLRDACEPCISCGNQHTGQYHAGHYMSVGAHPELRFDEKNCHKQCAPCNNHLSGNLIEYRKSLIKKIGVVRVEALENHQSIDRKKTTLTEIIAIKNKYLTKCRGFKK